MSILLATGGPAEVVEFDVGLMESFDVDDNVDDNVDGEFSGLVRHCRVMRNQRKC
jgi:hypothetical protein